MSAILIVEDSEEYSQLLTKTMGDHQTTCVRTVDEALNAIRNHSFDLILLDIGLPEKNGYALLSEIQAERNLRPIPVICLTGRSDVSDKVTAFSLGAEDYIVKPFDPIELRARISSKLARNLKAYASHKTIIGDLEIDHDRHRVLLNEINGSREIDLTQTEFKLLCCLAKRINFVFSRDQLLVAAWGSDARVLDRVVDKHLCTLRKKLGRYSKQIKSIPGIGYKFLEPSSKERAVS